MYSANKMKNRISSNYKQIVRVVLGGSLYYGVPDDLVASARNWYDPSYRFNNLGFRCIRRVK